MFDRQSMPVGAEHTREGHSVRPRSENGDRSLRSTDL